MAFEKLINRYAGNFEPFVRVRGNSLFINKAAGEDSDTLYINRLDIYIDVVNKVIRLQFNDKGEFRCVCPSKTSGSYRCVTTMELTRMDHIVPGRYSARTYPAEHVIEFMYEVEC